MPNRTEINIRLSPADGAIGFVKIPLQPLGGAQLPEMWQRPQRWLVVENQIQHILAASAGHRMHHKRIEGGHYLIGVRALYNFQRKPKPPLILLLCAA